MSVTMEEWQFFPGVVMLSQLITPILAMLRDIYEALINDDYGKELLLP